MNLGERAVICARWEWRDGMQTTTGQRIPIRQSDRPVRGVVERIDVRYVTPDGGMAGPRTYAFPDLDDPATLGCLLALVREAWVCPCLHVRPVDTTDGVMWQAWNGTPATDRWCNEELVAPTEAEALVLALENAP